MSGSLHQQIIDLVKTRRVNGSDIARILNEAPERVFEALVHLEARGVLDVQEYRTKDRRYCRWVAA